MRPTLRENLQVASLLLATLSMLLICAFVYSNYNPNGDSFVSPAPRGWIISNRVALATWLLGSLTLAVGKGKLWLPLLLWTISTPLCAGFIIFMGSVYQLVPWTRHRRFSVAIPVYNFSDFRTFNALRRLPLLGWCLQCEPLL